jgi:hypothetical protein
LIAGIAACIVLSKKIKKQRLQLSENSQSDSEK